MYKQREAAFKEARLLAGLPEIDEGLQGLAIVRTSSVTASKGSKDGSEQAEQRKSIPKEIPEIAVDPSRMSLGSLAGQTLEHTQQTKHNYLKLSVYQLQQEKNSELFIDTSLP